MAQIEDTLQALDNDHQEQQDEGDGDENSAGDESEEGGNNNGRGGKEKRVKRTKATKKATKKERKEKAKSEKANVDKREGGRSPRGKDTGKKGDGAAAVANNGTPPFRFLVIICNFMYLLFVFIIFYHNLLFTGGHKSDSFIIIF
jgi:hypothetical protein